MRHPSQFLHGYFHVAFSFFTWTHTNILNSSQGHFDDKLDLHFASYFCFFLSRDKMSADINLNFGLCLKKALLITQFGNLDSFSLCLLRHTHIYLVSYWPYFTRPNDLNTTLYNVLVLMKGQPSKNSRKYSRKCSETNHK